MTHKVKPGAAAAAHGLRGIDLAGRQINPTNNADVIGAQAGPRGRAGNLARCANCGAALAPRRGSRRQKFCGGRCRDAARRARNHARFLATRYPYGPKPRSVRNRPLSSTDCNGVFANQPRRINVAPRVVIDVELFAGRDWSTSVSPDGVICKICRPRTSAETAA
jgi:hypothetical protein